MSTRNMRGSVQQKAYQDFEVICHLFHEHTLDDWINMIKYFQTHFGKKKKKKFVHSIRDGETTQSIQILFKLWGTSHQW